MQPRQGICHYSAIPVIYVYFSCTRFNWFSFIKSCHLRLKKHVYGSDLISICWKFPWHGNTNSFTDLRKGYFGLPIPECVSCAHKCIKTFAQIDLFVNLKTKTSSNKLSSLFATFDIRIDIECACLLCCVVWMTFTSFWILFSAEKDTNSQT